MGVSRRQAGHGRGRRAGPRARAQPPDPPSMPLPTASPLLADPARAPRRHSNRPLPNAAQLWHTFDGKCAKDASRGDFVADTPAERSREWWGGEVRGSPAASGRPSAPRAARGGARRRRAPLSRARRRLRPALYPPAPPRARPQPTRPASATTNATRARGPRAGWRATTPSTTIWIVRGRGSEARTPRGPPAAPWGPVPRFRTLWDGPQRVQAPDSAPALSRRPPATDGSDDCVDEFTPGEPHGRLAPAPLLLACVWVGRANALEAGAWLRHTRRRRARRRALMMAPLLIIPRSARPADHPENTGQAARMLKQFATYRAGQ
jgi:hypothetical protein